MLKRIQSTLAEIKATLLNNGVIRQLLCNDSNNCLNMETPTVKSAEKYITLKPVFQFENTDDYAQNGMINIVFSDGEPDDEANMLDGVVQVNVVYNTDKWELVDNKIRTLELADKVIELLNNKKFSVSNKIEFTSMQQLILSKQLVGYALLFAISDGNSNLEKF
jgi:flagellar hook assembly protein FlgD